MANSAQAKKRILTIKKRTERNKSVKSRTKTEIKKARIAIKSGTNTDAALSNAQSAIDKACSKGVMHKNTAARKKSRLAKAAGKS